MQNNKNPVKTPKKICAKKWKTVQKHKKPQAKKKINNNEKENDFFEYHDNIYKQIIQNQNNDNIVSSNNNSDDFQGSTNMSTANQNCLIVDYSDNDVIHSSESWGDFQNI